MNPDIEETIVDENFIDDNEADILAATGKLPDKPTDDTPAPLSEMDAFDLGVKAAKEGKGEEAGFEADVNAKPAPKKDEPKAEDPPKEEEPKSDEAVDVEAEIKALGMKEETAKRFRALTGQLAELREKDKTWEAERTALLSESKLALDFQDMVINTGAQPQQVGAVLGYLAAVNSGDPQKIRLGYDALKAELVNVAKLIGEPIDLPGVKHDPLDAHPDLKEEVQDGALDRKRALELAQARDAAKQIGERQQQTQAQAEGERVKQEAIQSVASWAQAESLKIGPEIYAARIAPLKPMIARIQAALPPNQWAGAIQELYQASPMPTPAPRAPAPPAPIRPGGRSTGSMDRKPKDDMDAFEMGLAAANARR